MTVHLVGAGPGDPDLLTMRAVSLLARADVIVHDRLVDRRVLASAAPWAELVDVGKTPGSRRNSQDEINAILVDRGRRFETVVRLKGGDPFVFGRGGEEAEVLLANGIAVEVVPGVSSSIAAPAAAGIPVTMRGIASGVTVVTAHQDPAQECGRRGRLPGVPAEQRHLRPAPGRHQPDGAGQAPVRVDHARAARDDGPPRRDLLAGLGPHHHPPERPVPLRAARATSPT
jgi:precorrin-6B methylase 1